MGRPQRLTTQTGRHSLVDGIPFQLPVASKESPALMAAFTVDAKVAQSLIPGNEVHLLRWWSRAFLLITIIDYRNTNIGKYIEYSIGFACTQGKACCPAASCSTFSEDVRHRPIRVRPPSQLPHLGQGRQGHLGNAEASGKSRFHHWRRCRFVPL